MNESISRLVFNYLNARKSWESLCYMVDLNLKEPKPEVREFVDKNELLIHLRYLAYKDFFIELYKILKDRDNNSDNVFKLLRLVHDGNEYKEKAQNLLIELNSNIDIINKITNIRDKYYAHLDKDYEKYLNEKTLIENFYNCFILIEKAILILTLENYLLQKLEELPSRDEFKLT